MDREIVILVMRSIPIIILSLGCLFLLIKKKINIILFGIICLLTLEVFSNIMPTENLTSNILMLYFSGILYLVLIYNLYEKLFFNLVNKKWFHRCLIVIFIASLLLIYQGNPNSAFHYIAVIELFILVYPISYFIKLAKQEIDYDFTNFILNSIIFLFFCLEVIAYIMLKFLIETDLLDSVNITIFRYFLIQLFYLSLIYFGWKIQKK